MMRVFAVTIAVVVVLMFYMSDQTSANEELARKTVEKQEKNEEREENAIPDDQADVDEEKMMANLHKGLFFFGFSIFVIMILMDWG